MANVIEMGLVISNLMYNPTFKISDCKYNRALNSKINDKVKLNSEISSSFRTNGLNSKC